LGWTESGWRAGEGGSGRVAGLFLIQIGEHPGPAIMRTAASGVDDKKPQRPTSPCDKTPASMRQIRATRNPAVATHRQTNGIIVSKA